MGDPGYPINDVARRAHSHQPINFVMAAMPPRYSDRARFRGRD